MGWTGFALQLHTMEVYTWLSSHVFLPQNACLGVPCTRVDCYRALPTPLLRYEGGLWLGCARLCGMERPWDAGQVIDSTVINKWRALSYLNGYGYLRGP